MTDYELGDAAFANKKTSKRIFAATTVRVLRNSSRQICSGSSSDWHIRIFGFCVTRAWRNDTLPSLERHQKEMVQVPRGRRKILC